MKLIIVESPHKSDTISKFLGSEYKVMASKGHIRDLASSGKMGLGVDVDNNFQPRYIISSDKASIIKELKKAVSKADDVYLATDPDREGEAISWHLAQVLNLDVKTTKRLEFHEITKNAILKALDNPKTIDMNLVRSQETRRIIDRLMGFRLSNILQKKISSRAGGRVQSVVLRFVVDKEKEIQNFVPVEYWTIKGTFKDENKVLECDLSSYKNKTIKINNEEEADNIIKNLPEIFSISNIKKERRNREPKAPFITSTLQQDAYSQFHFSTKKTSSIAQRLYEGIEINGVPTGLITYMRTDSIRLSDEFKTAAIEKIKKDYGEQYVGKGKVQKASKNVQDAHEAIRPTDLNLTPSSIKQYLSKDEYSLYTMIYERALSSLMSARVDDITTIYLEGNDYTFSCSGSTLVFDGYYRIYKKYEEKEEKVELPVVELNEQFSKEKIEKTQHFTKAPTRYNEGKLVKVMQENGIGRPSTYASTITNLLNHKYVENTKTYLIPTEQGIITTEVLEEHFTKYMDVSYTAKMETALDEIAEGKIDEIKLLSDFWTEFQTYFAQAEKDMKKIPPKEVGRNCPICNSPLVVRHSRYGDFVGCSNYPQCTYIEKKENVIIDHKCPRCGSDLVKRKGKRGEFIGCSNYPKCTYMESLDGKEIDNTKKTVVIPEDAPLCPKCKTGHLIEKKNRFGKTFVGCSNYPKCNYIQKEKKEKDK